MTSKKRTSGGIVHAPCTARDDWPARSDAMRRIGELQPANIDAASIRAAELFGFDAILRPTWIYVARTARSMSTSATYFPQRWQRLKNTARPNLGRPLVVAR